MLAIRMQRTGRKGHAMFRIIVQDSRRTPTSGNLVELLGNYDPHTKMTTLSKDRANFYLEHGAQPSPIVVRIFKKEGIKLPKWVTVEPKKQSKTRSPEKLRKNNPEPKTKPDVAEAKPETKASEVEVPAEPEKTTNTSPADEAAPVLESAEPEVAPTPETETPEESTAESEPTPETNQKDAPAKTE